MWLTKKAYPSCFLRCVVNSDSSTVFFGENRFDCLIAGVKKRCNQQSSCANGVFLILKKKKHKLFHENLVPPESPKEGD